MAKAYYGSKISTNLAKTPEGYLICKNVPIARTGTQEYLGSEFGMKDDKLYKVLRPTEEVFSPAAIASFEGKPVCNEHPDEDVLPENFKKYIKGTVRDVRKGEGDLANFLVADLIIYDASLIKAIEDGKREISCGYDCLWEETGDSTFTQKDIRGNHIAVVAKGRAGHKVAIRDKKPRGGSKMKKDSILGRMLSAFAKDADPEELMEASRAVHEAETNQGEGDDPKPEGSAKDEAMEARFKGIEDSIAELKEVLGSKEKEEAPVKDVDSEEDPEEDDALDSLDELEGELSGESEEDKVEKSPEEMNAEDADFIEPEENAKEEAAKVKDAAVEIIRNLKPVVASLPKAQRKRAADSLVTLIRGHVADAQYGALLNAQKSAKANDSAVDDADYGKMIRDKFNPHYKKSN